MDRNGNPSGKGIEIFEFDNCFIIQEGIFVRGELSGLARVISTLKETQEVKIWYGQHESGKMNGIITFNSGLSATYSGYYKNDYRDGVGKLTNEEGLVYTGNWRNNKRNGKGIQTLPDGSI